jgi:hypothetical protein
MNLIFKTENYIEQQQRLPDSGRNILAHHDEESIIVYQAYRPTIGEFAAQNGYFGGQFSFDRMTWIKTNFLWMMYRSGWGTKQGQEIVLAIRLKKSFFNKVLAKAVAAQFRESNYSNNTEWKNALKNSPIRFQWDPDRDPAGNALTRRAIQLGLKGDIVKEYAKDAILNIYDASEYVKLQRQIAFSGEYRKLMTPKETVYIPPHDHDIPRNN